jgi:hypothetical protein
MQTTPQVPQSSPIPSTWSLPEAIRKRFGRSVGTQRCMVAEGHLLLVLHQMPKPDETERKGAFFWRNPEGAWQSHGVEHKGPNALPIFLRNYRMRLTELEQLENAAVTATQFHDVLEGVYRALQDAREKLPEVAEIISLRDEAATLERVGELLVMDAQAGLNFISARQAEQQATATQNMAKAAHRLNILAALFLPVSAVSGIFGMEIRSGLQDAPKNFYIILATALVLGLVMAVSLRAGGKK